MPVENNVLITILREDFKKLDHVARSRYGEEVFGFIDDAKVYESKKNRKVVHLVFEGVHWTMSNPCVRLVEEFIRSIPHHIAILSMEWGLPDSLETGENLLEGDAAFLGDCIPSLDGDFWHFAQSPLSDAEIRA